MRSKMLCSSYNPETGESLVVIRNRYGDFFGSAQLHPEDKPFESQFAGCHYAEMRAHISCTKHRIIEAKAQIKAIENLEKTLMGKRDYNPKSMEAKLIRKRKFELKAEHKKLKELLANIKKGLKESMTARDEFNKKYSNTEKE